MCTQVLESKQLIIYDFSHSKSFDLINFIDYFQIVMIIETIRGPVSHLITNSLYRALHYIKSKKAKTMMDFIAKQQPPEFLLEDRFSLVLTLMLMCRMFTSIMPLMVVFCLMSFSFLWISDKMIFILYSKRPDLRSEIFMNVICSLLPISSMISIIMAILQYGGFTFFQTSRNFFSSSDNFDVSTVIIFKITVRIKWICSINLS